MNVMEAIYCIGSLSFPHQTPQSPSLKWAGVRKGRPCPKLSGLVHEYMFMNIQSALQNLGPVWGSGMRRWQEAERPAVACMDGRNPGLEWPKI